MKVLVTGTRGVPDVMGGVETHVGNLFPYIASSGVDVTVARRSSYVSDGLHEWRGLSLVDIPCPKRKSLEAIVHTFRAVNYARRHHFDIVHINAVGPALLTPYAKLLGLKVVFTHHGPDYDRQKWGRAARFALRLGERLGCRHADEVIVISDLIRGIVSSRYGRTRGVSLIYNGVPEASPCEAPEYFSILGIEKGRYVLAMCRFVPEKRLDDLVRAFNAASMPDGLRLVLAGDADFEDEYSLSLKRLAAESGVVLTGFVKGERQRALLSGAALFVLPSSHEGLPIALLEAMSYGLRVLVSDIPANLEVGLPTDCYFRCGDVEDLSARLPDFIAADAPVYDMEAYDWQAIAASTLDVYKRLI